MRLFRMTVLVGAIAAVFAPAALALRFSDNSLLPPSGVVGKPYFHKLDGAGGCNENDYEFRVIGGTSLPPGLELRGSSTDWRIEGTPTAAGKWDVWLELWGDGGECPIYEPTPRKAERMITISIDRPALPPLDVTTRSAPIATATAPYSLTLQASGGGSQSWSVVAGQLPPGLTLSAGGAIAGVPTTPGTYTFAARVGDATRSDTQQLTIVVRAPLTLRVPRVRPAEVGEPFDLAAAAAGGSGTSVWKLEGALPAGLVFDPQSARITGTPELHGTFPVKLTVADNEGRTASVALTLRVERRLAIVTRRLIGGRVGRRFVSRVRVGGGVERLRFRAIRGRFPLGIRMNTRTGILIGTPRKAGVYRLTILVRDSLGVESRQALVLRVVRRR
jgi:hypothetical protein